MRNSPLAGTELPGGARGNQLSERGGGSLEDRRSRARNVRLYL